MAFRFQLAVVLVLSFCSVGPGVEPIAIDSRLELMVDDYLIDKLNGAVLVLQRPTPRQVAIVHDEPWEGNSCSYYTVFRDGDIYRMYYRGANCDDKTGKATHPVFTCHAQSRDGIHWTKPELGIVEFRGSKKNNIIWSGKGTHNFVPFRDTNPACKPDEKYKALAGGKGGPRGYALFAYKSPDGVHWSLLHDEPVIVKGKFDSQNLAFWDTVRGCYVSFYRETHKKHKAVMTATSDDFITWSDPVWLEYSGAPAEHLYTNQITPYDRAPHVYIGFPMRFVRGPNPLGYKYPDVCDGVLMTSRDGRNFKRWGEAFIRPGLQKERWVHRNNMTAWGILTTRSDISGCPDELSIFSTEGYTEGPYVGDSCCRLRRYTLRIDGFVSLQAPLAGGEMVTKPILFDGKELVINYSTSAAGSMLVEIQDDAGKPIPGYTLSDCTEIIGDQIDRVVTWKRKRDNIRALAGKPIRLRFSMKDADLYSFQFRKWPPRNLRRIAR